MAKRKHAGRIEEFAEDLGRLLGTATAKAENWLDQRKAIAKHLTEIRDTAGRLLGELGHKRQKAARRVAKARQDAPQRRKMSAKARKAISDAQKKRWAAKRAAGKK